MNRSARTIRYRAAGRRQLVQRLPVEAFGGRGALGRGRSARRGERAEVGAERVAGVLRGESGEVRLQLPAAFGAGSRATPKTGPPAKSVEG